MRKTLVMLALVLCNQACSSVCQLEHGRASDVKAVNDLVCLLSDDRWMKKNLGKDSITVYRKNVIVAVYAPERYTFDNYLLEWSAGRGYSVSKLSEADYLERIGNRDKFIQVSDYYNGIIVALMEQKGWSIMAKTGKVNHVSSDFVD